MENIIELKSVTKTYKLGNVLTHALHKVSLEINKGEIIVLLGASGSGKTTMLNVISGLDRPTSGHIFYDGVDISKFGDRKITKFRREKLGFIFQTYNLLEHLNVRENIKVGASLGHSNADIDEIIDIVDLKDHERKYMHQLSGGQQQRVSIARALAKKPEVMFCDEPTGALDEVTGKNVLQALIEVNSIYKTTMIIVTHNPGIALIGDRIIKMNSGEIKEIIVQEKRTAPKDIPWG